MKSHISPSGPGRCTAEKGNCPFGDESNHFSTLAAAKDEYEKRLASAYGEAPKATKLRLTPREKEIRGKNAELAKTIVEERAKAGEITYEDANPVRAKRRLEEAISFAESRENTHLVDKLSQATVLPSGAFKLADGSRANVDKYLKAKQELDSVEATREAMVEELSELAKTVAPSSEAYKLKTTAGTFSLSFKPGFDENEFAKLPAALQAKLKSPREGLSIEAARESLSPELLSEISTESQVLDFVMGKPITPELSSVKPALKLTGENADDKFNSGLRGIAAYYETVHKTSGTVKALRDEKSTNNSAVKAATAKISGPVFVPARSQSNGLLVTRRVTINSSLAKTKLTAEQLKSITVERLEVDPKLAETVLPKETFDKIFGQPKASLRVVEAS